MSSDRIVISGVTGGVVERQEINDFITNDKLLTLFIRALRMFLPRSSLQCLNLTTQKLRKLLMSLRMPLSSGSVESTANPSSAGMVPSGTLRPENGTSAVTVPMDLPCSLRGTDLMLCC